MGNLSGESREQNRKDKVTRFRSVTYARQLGLLVNTLWSHLKKKNKLHKNFINFPTPTIEENSKNIGTNCTTLYVQQSLSIMKKT